MITTENLVTKVQFGIDGKATIGVFAKKGTLTLQMLAGDKQIGDKLENGDAQKLPKIEMDFFNTQSIDVLIKALECIKSNYRPPGYIQLAEAC